MGYWDSFFTGMSWSGGTYGSGDLDDGDSAPEEVILYQVWWQLYQDPVLQKIFTPASGSLGERIEVMEIRNPLEFRAIPRLQVYLGSLQVDQVPTRVDMTNVVVFAGLRQSLESGIARLEPGEPMQGSVMRQVKKVLNNDQKLQTQVNGKVIGIAQRSQQEGGLTYLVDEDSGGERLAMTTELQWNYEVKVDYLSQRLLPIKTKIGN